MTSTAIESAAEAIVSADFLLFAAGAGMGVDSGLPDFRGPGGFWNAYPCYEDLRLSFADVGRPSLFVDAPHKALGVLRASVGALPETRSTPGLFAFVGLVIRA